MGRVKDLTVLGVGDDVSWMCRGKLRHGSVSHILEEFGTDELIYYVRSTVPNLLWEEDEYFTVYPQQILEAYPYKETNA